ncbi:uncharacterized protein TNCV_518971 [Trichonephila clavipes]|nr:uncharacterized protein TNCV_518971 [Trichonephila clavipes]
MREKGCNRLVPGPDYMGDALKLSNQAPRVSGESLQMCVAWRCPDGTQHLFCWPILALSGQSQASNGPVVDSRDLNLVFDHTEATHNKLLLSSSITKYTVEPYWICQVIYSQFGLAIHQNDHQARRRFVEWAQNEIAVFPDFHKRILFSDEAHFWLNGYVNKQNCRIWSEANPQVYVETTLHPEKLTVWCALWAGGILLQKR